jgi:hypothetical protein
MLGTPNLRLDQIPEVYGKNFQDAMRMNRGCEWMSENMASMKQDTQRTLQVLNKPNSGLHVPNNS